MILLTLFLLIFRVKKLPSSKVTMRVCVVRCSYLSVSPCTVPHVLFKIYGHVALSSAVPVLRLAEASAASGQLSLVSCSDGTIT